MVDTKFPPADGTILVLKKSGCETTETAKVRNGEGAKWPALNAGLEEENNRKYFFFYKYKVNRKKLTTFSRLHLCVKTCEVSNP